jgi:hypothetical protein
MLQMGWIQQHNASGTIGRIWERGAAVTEEGYRRIFQGTLVIDEELTAGHSTTEILVKIFADGDD